MNSAVQSFLLPYKRQTFRYGRSDCALFSLAALREIWDVHIPPEEIGRWATKKQALTATQAHGEGLYEAACKVASKVGLVYVYTPLLQCGDIAAANVSGRVCLGVMENASDIVCLGAKGLIRFPRRFILSGWRAK